jgi:hypothetical protein
MRMIPVPINSASAKLLDFVKTNPRIPVLHVEVWLDLGFAAFFDPLDDDGYMSAMVFNCVSTPHADSGYAFIGYRGRILLEEEVIGAHAGSSRGYAILSGNAAFNALILANGTVLWKSGEGLDFVGRERLLAAHQMQLRVLDVAENLFKECL